MATRRERVVLELDDQFTTGMARAAAASALLAKELNSLDGAGRKSKGSMSSTAVETDKVGKASRRSAGDVDALGSAVRKNGADIDKFSGRLRIFADAAAVLGPGLAPIGAVAIPAVTGLASQLGFAAIAGGVAIAAFQGVGDALTAVNKAALEPTEANLEKARQAMEQISPAARGFVRELRSMIPQLKNLRDIGAENMFPGLTEGLDGLQGALPRVERIMASVSRTLGDIGAEVGTSLGGERWAPFLDFIATDAPSALRDMATSVGNVAHAMAELWMAFDPLNDSFSTWMVDATRSLDEWASGLSKTQGFADFVDYVSKTGPQVAETFGAIGNMLVQVAQAAAPLGGPVLQGLEAVADVISAIADSDLGTPIFTAVAALALYNRALQATAALSKTAFMGGAGAAAGATATRRQQLTAMRADYGAARASQAQSRQTTSGMVPVPLLKQGTVESERLRTSLKGMGAEAGKAGALIGGLAVASTGAGDALGVTNTVSLALMGSVLPGLGTAAGATVGAMLDLRAASDGVRDSIARASKAMADMDMGAMVAEYDTITAKQREWSESLNDPINNPFDIDAIKTRATSLMSVLDGTARAAAAQKRELQGAFSASGALSGAEVILRSQGLLADGMSLTAGSAKKQAAALREAQAAARETGRAFTGLGADVNNAEVSLGGWLGQLEAQNRALSNFADNAIRAGRRGLREGLIKELQAAGPEGARRMNQLANGSQAALDRANMAWVRGRQAVDKYEDSVTQATTGQVGKVNVFSRAIRSLPRRVQTDIKQNGLERSRSAIVDLTRRYKLAPKDVRTLIREQGGKPTKAMVDRIIASAQKLDRTNPSSTITARDNASSTINRVSAALRGIPPFVSSTVVVNTLRRTTFSVGGQQAIADGGTVQGAREPYRDKVLTYLAPGEEVITNRNGQADRFRADRAARRIPAYADGGTTAPIVPPSVAVRPTVGATLGLGSSDPRGISGAGGFAGGVMAAPVVNVSMRGARMAIDAGELGVIVGEVVDDAIASADDMTSMVERTAPAYG